MRVAYLCDSRLAAKAANTVHVMKMAQALSLEGHEVTLHLRAFFSDPDPWRAAPTPYERFGVAPVFRLRPWRLPRFPGHSHIHGLLMALAACLGGNQFVYSRSVPAFLWARMFGMRGILELHRPLRESAGPVLVALLSLLRGTSSASKLVVITHSLAETVAAEVPRLRDRILVAPDAADPIPDDISPQLGSNASGRPRVGYAGHLYRGKGMEVIERLADLCPWADFHVVGGHEEDLRRWRRRVGAERGNLTFHGHVPHRQVAGYLLSFDVLLLPLQHHVGTAAGDRRSIARWTSPLKAFEYMASGRAIVCSDLPVLREIFVDGVNALLCPPENPHAWAEAIQRLAADPGLRDRLGGRARAIFLERHTWRARARRLVPCG